MIFTLELIEQAILARKRAYVPYSSYPVGAAILTDDDNIFVGCNVENAASPATICAERVALTSAIASGRSKFIAIAVVGHTQITPCGICRQVMAEIGPNMIVYLSDPYGNFRTTNVRSLLPDAFDASSLTR